MKRLFAVAAIAAAMLIPGIASGRDVIVVGRPSPTPRPTPVVVGQTPSPAPTGTAMPTITLPPTDTE